MRPGPQLNASRRSALQILCGAASTVLIPGLSSSLATQQIRTNQQGMVEFQAHNMKLVTDLPLDEELKAWPGYLDQAFPQWLAFFGATKSRLESFNPTVFLVGDKARWKSLGLLDAIPPLEDGFQNVNDLYIAEQPSVYYRRLLFLHEATHAVMHRCLGSGGGPWLWEGFADYLGTHRLTDGRLEMGYLPTSPKQVSYWGRIKLIQDSIKQENAPKLSEIVSFPDMRTDRMLRYAWSWAACTFLLSHPETRTDFQTLYRAGFETGSPELFERMSDQWPGLSLRWRAFVDDLDFGTDLASSSLLLNDKLTGESRESKSITIEANRGWQIATGPIAPGTKLEIEATGRVVVRQQPTPGPKTGFTESPSSSNKVVTSYPWESEPQGITVEYNRGLPLGALVGAWAVTEREESSMPLERFLVGATTTLKAPSERAVLLLRVNDRASELKDNSNTYRVVIK